MGGETEYKEGNKKALLKTLVKDVINKYIKYHDSAGYGYLEEPKVAWKEFMLNKALEAKGVTQDVLAAEDHTQVEAIVNSMNNRIDRYFLHGDCGVHNFLFNET